MQFAGFYAQVPGRRVLCRPLETGINVQSKKYKATELHIQKYSFCDECILTLTRASIKLLLSAGLKVGVRFKRWPPIWICPVEQTKLSCEALNKTHPVSIPSSISLAWPAIEPCNVSVSH